MKCKHPIKFRESLPSGQKWYCTKCNTWELNMEPKA